MVQEIRKRRERAIKLFRYFAETAMGVDIHAQETTSEYCQNVTK